MIKYKNGQGYKAGNMTDQIKHSSLKKLVNVQNPKVYFEFHSGKGLYGQYPGSTLRVLNIMSSKRQKYFAFLHEINSTRRGHLINNTKAFSTYLQVKSNWKKQIHLYT